MKKLLFLFLFFLVLTGCVNIQTKPVACTEEAKICPDGSAVVRVGPNCEFEPCPLAKAVPADWLTFTAEDSSFTFQYPEALPTIYTHAQDAWPPVVTLGAGALVCNPTPMEYSISERVTQKIINNRNYCLKALSEGAAGSTYTDYKYSTEIEGKLVELAFTLRAVQCYNYDDPKQSECIKERETFDLDALVDQILSSLKFN